MSPRVAAPFVTALLLLWIGAIARAPYAPPAPEGGLLRLSWRMRDASEETCRLATQAELDALPVHMRAPRICEHVALSYRLLVQVDGSSDTVTIAPGGIRRDRPIYVLWQQSIAPGSRHVRVRFDRLQADNSEAALKLTMDTVLDAENGRIELITLDNGRLVHVAKVQ